MADRASWIETVARRFPDRERRVEQLAARPGPFRDMCEELAEALKALEATDRAPSGVREARREEWRSAIETLAQEIEQALRETRVVPFGRGS